MNKFKRIALALLALASTLSIVALAGCGEEDNASQSSSPAASESTGGSSSDDGGDENECTNSKGHSYSEATGLCEYCEKEAVIPALKPNQSFPEAVPCDATDDNCSCLTGNGMKYHRLELEEGCHTVEIGASGEVWLSFSVEQAGQYVLYSVGGSNSSKVTRYNANAGNVPNEGVKGIVKGEDYYSFVNCGKIYFNYEWRATYRIQGKAGNLVKVCFVRVCEPKWEPESVRTKVYATELENKAAEKESPELELVEVPYTSTYFYDETVGYYRLGSKENPGKIIYAAINAEASRLFEGSTFSTILQGTGTALNLQDGYTEDGNYNVLNYTPFIVNWADENAAWGNRPGSDNTEPTADPTKICYENYCNSDGVHPVNKELFKFLNLFVRHNKPADTSISYEDWNNQADYVWLSACFYYGQVIRGTQANPLLLEKGEKTVELPAWDNLYCAFRGTETYTLTCDDPNVSLAIGKNTRINGPFSVTMQAPVTFTLSHINGAAATATITVSDGKGTENNPIAITELGEVDLSPIAVYAANDVIFYQACYTYTTTEKGTFTMALPSETTANIAMWTSLSSIDESADGLQYTVSYLANDTIYVYVTWAATSTDTTVPVVKPTLTFEPTPAA